MLTPKQLKLFKFIKEYKSKNEIIPTFDEMKDFMNVKSKSGIYQMLGYLEWKGYIKKYPAHARAITILKEVA
jgi:SOS-response transcriptional repressor LexA